MGDWASRIGVPATGLAGTDIFGVITASSWGEFDLSGDIVLY